MTPVLKQDEPMGSGAPTPPPAVAFLDFDGVTHCMGAGAFFSQAPQFREILADLDEMLGKPAGVVISSSWRLKMLDANGAFDCREAERLLGLEPGRVLGCTPHIDRRSRTSEMVSWLEARGLLANTPWIFLDDSPGLFDGGPPDHSALLVDGARGISGPCWGAAARCLVASQGLDAARGKRELARAAAAFAQAGSGADPIHSGAWRGFEHLAQSCARKGWASAQKITELCALAGHPELGARLALEFGQDFDLGPAALLIAHAVPKASPSAIAPCWDALALLAERSTEAAEIGAMAAARLPASQGLGQAEHGAIGVLLARAPSGSLAKEALREGAARPPGLSLASLAGAARLGWINNAELQAGLALSSPAARAAFGPDAVDSFLLDLANAASHAPARRAAPSSRL